MLRSTALFGSLLVACGGEVAPADGGALLDAAASDAGCTPPPGEPFACEDLTPDPACGARWVVGVTGRVETTLGAPVDGARAQLCVRVHPSEVLICLPPPVADASGAFAIVVPREARCQSRAAMRAIAPGRGLATTYCPVALDASAGPLVEVASPYRLPPVTAAAAPPRGDADAERDVVFSDGVVLTLVPSALPSADEYAALAGALVDVSATECFRGALAPDGAYAFDPEAPIRGGAAVSIPNTAGLAAGAEVDLYVLGGLETRLLDGAEVEEGELGRFGLGVVSADGAAIVAATDARLPYLSWLVWRAR